jgi:aminomethyltransferase
VPNAANTAEVARRLAAAAPPGVVVENVHSDYSVLAVQGPRSTEVLADIGLPTDQEYMAFAMARWQDGEPFAVCRTGYTGEHGYELMPRVEFAGALWDALLDSARRQDGLACGLGARDTLRTEMGYPLHGHELSLDITPVQARLGWAVGWNKPEFWAHELLRKEKQEGARRLLWGLEAQDRGVPRAGMSVLDKEGASLGTVTSGTFSPTRRIGIALALLDRKAAEGSAVDVDVRGKPLPATVVRPPFVKPSTK